MSRPDVVVVTGSRDWTDRRRVAEELASFKQGTMLLHGACRGLDEIAAQFGKRYRFNVIALPYFEDEAGREARNRSMFAMARALQDCRRCWVAGMPTRRRGAGTIKAIRIADELGISIRVVKP